MSYHMCVGGSPQSSRSLSSLLRNTSIDLFVFTGSLTMPLSIYSSRFSYTHIKDTAQHCSLRDTDWLEVPNIGLSMPCHASPTSKLWSKSLVCVDLHARMRRSLYISRTLGSFMATTGSEWTMSLSMHLLLFEDKSRTRSPSRSKFLFTITTKHREIYGQNAYANRIPLKSWPGATNYDRRLYDLP